MPAPTAGVPDPDPEAARLDALGRLRILDTPPEEAFDRVARIAARLFGVPIALVSFIDARRQWCKARHGLEAHSFPRELAFCTHTVLGQGPLAVPDLAADPRFAGNPLVAAGPRLRFYAGAPLRTATGHNVGTVSVIDTRPRPDLGPERLGMLTDLADLVVERLEARAAAEALREEAQLHRQAGEELARALARRDELLRELRHRVGNTLQAAAAIAQVQAAQAGGPAAGPLRAAADRIVAFARMHRAVFPDEAAADGDLGTLLAAVARDLDGGTGRVAVETPGGPALADPDLAMHIGLLARELVANALDHGGGGVRVALARRPHGGLRLEVRDQGAGPGPGVAYRGVGSVLVEAIAAQLGATVAGRAKAGWAVTVEIPATPPAPSRGAGQRG